MIQLTTLVENTTTQDLPVEHGLSLHLTTQTHGQILFDLGQGTLFAENAKRLGIPLQQVDCCILSHGHYDHGGGLATFLALHPQAPVYLHRRAFEPHYSLRADGRHFIGLDPSLSTHPRIHFTDNTYWIDPTFLLFADVQAKRLPPPGNRLLFGPGLTEPDSFAHEQSLWLKEGPIRLLVAGCAHAGILNILDRVHALTGEWPTHVVAGMHLVKSGYTPEAEATFIAQLAEGLRVIPDCVYYTLHCTGLEAYAHLKEQLGNRIHYLAGGEKITFG